MALQPSLRPLIIAGRHDAPHTLDIFLDYVCPYRVLKPLLDDGGKYAGKVKAIIRLHVQPWHASSIFTHETALAITRVSPQSFWPYTLALFKKQNDFYDIPASNLTPVQIRDKLAELAEPIIGQQKVDEAKDLLKLKSTPNGGNAVTEELKYTIKFGRQNGIHVSPTVLWDGLIASEISSSWGEKEWTDFLATKAST